MSKPLLATVLLSLLPLGNPSVADDLTGDWRGEIILPGPDGSSAFHYAILAFGPDSGTITAPHLGIHGSPIESLSGTDVEIRFSFDAPDTVLSFSGSLVDDVLDGIVRSADKNGTLTARRIRFEDVRLPDYVGSYSCHGPARLVVASGQRTLFLYEPPTGLRVVAFPTGMDEFIHGQGLVDLLPEGGRLLFERSSEGVVTSVRIDRGSGRPTVCTREPLPYREEQVRFDREVELAGTLRIPTGASHRVGIVLVHGSGHVGRDGYYGHLRFLADHLARHGFVVLTYDKRGVGLSTGDLESATLQDLAEDAAAALDYLRSRPEVESVGYYGISQGGIFAPQAIRGARDVDFAIIVGSSIVPGALQETYRTWAQMLADGYSPIDAAHGARLQAVKFAYADRFHDVLWEAYSSALADYGKELWFRLYVDSPAQREHPAWAFWQADREDPAIGWTEIGIPVLALYGEHDVYTPRDASAAALREALGSQVSVVTIADAEHNLLRAESGSTAAFQTSPGFHPRYLATLDEWLGEVVPGLQRRRVGPGPEDPAEHREEGKSLAAPTALHEILQLGSTLEELRPLLVEACSTLEEHHYTGSMAAPFEEQIQIDCSGPELLGAPRKIELLFNDGPLGHAWILVESEEIGVLVAPLEHLFGPVVYSAGRDRVFESGQVALRSSPPEILVATSELIADLTGFRP